MLGFYFPLISKQAFENYKTPHDNENRKWIGENPFKFQGDYIWSKYSPVSDLSTLNGDEPNHFFFANIKCKIRNQALPINSF